MAYIPVISDDNDTILSNVWNDMKCIEFMNNNSDLAEILVKNLVKIAEQKDLYENLLNMMSKSGGNREHLQVDLYNYNTVWYKGDERGYATVGQSEEPAGFSLFQKTVGDIGYEYETKVSALTDLFCKMPRDLVMNNGKEYTLQEMLTRLVILQVVSAHIGDKCWVYVKNVKTVEYSDFYVATCCICVKYMPEGLTPIMTRTRTQALNLYDQTEDYSDMPPLIPISCSCSKWCYCE